MSTDREKLGCVLAHRCTGSWCPTSTEAASELAPARYGTTTRRDDEQDGTTGGWGCVRRSKVSLRSGVRPDIGRCDEPVLLVGLGQDDLGAEGLVGRHLHDPRKRSAVRPPGAGVLVRSAKLPPVVRPRPNAPKQPAGGNSTSIPSPSSSYISPGPCERSSSAPPPTANFDVGRQDARAAETARRGDFEGAARRGQWACVRGAQTYGEASWDALRGATIGVDGRLDDWRG